MLMSSRVSATLTRILESQVEESLKGIEGEMRQLLGRREKILKTQRDCIALCSKAIVHFHMGNRDEAHAEVKEAEKVLRGLQKEAGDGVLSKYLPATEAEFVEASALEAIVLGKRLPAAKDLGVSGEGYVLGLLDAVGEVKRLLLDSMMRSETDKAKGYFELMEGLYSALLPFAAYDHVANGVRRKLDVARILTEDVRGVMAEEARRFRLVSAMRDLETSLRRGTNKRAAGARPKKS